MTEFITKKIKNFNDKVFILAIIAPIVLYFAVFVYFPFVVNIYHMFCKYDFITAPQFVGLKNIKHLFTDNIAWEAIRNTVIFTVAGVPAVLILSLILAIILFNLKIGKQFLRSLVFTTFLPSWVIGAIIFKQWFSSNGGLINYALQCIGIPAVPWLTNTTWAIIAIIILNVWVYLGYYVVIFLAGISNINSELYEAAYIDGANNIKTFFYITVPQLVPTIVFVAMTAAINYLRTYPQVVILTNGGPYRTTQSALMDIFSTAYSIRNVGYASVLSVTLFVIILVITIIQMKASKFYSE